MLTPLNLRPPSLSDGAKLHQLIADCPPLDCNTSYAYHLIGEHFASTSVLACDAQGAVLGALTAYSPPQDPDVLFVWQVAVSAAARGQGLALRMLTEVHQRRQWPWIHTTIGPTNAASHALFARFAEQQQAPLERQPFIAADACGPGHEAEELIIVGPIQESQQSQ